MHKPRHLTSPLSGSRSKNSPSSQSAACNSAHSTARAVPPLRRRIPKTHSLEAGAVCGLLLSMNLYIICQRPNPHFSALWHIYKYTCTPRLQNVVAGSADSAIDYHYVSTNQSGGMRCNFLQPLLRVCSLCGSLEASDRENARDAEVNKSRRAKVRAETQALEMHFSHPNEIVHPSLSFTHLLIFVHLH
jgi:hypothetical protein